MNFKFVPFALTLMVFSTGVFAKFSSSLDVKIEALNYKRPESGVGNSGDVKFRRLQMFRGDMAVNINNEEKIFDSSIFIRNGFVGFQGPYVGVGFTLSEDNTLRDVQQAKIGRSRINMNANKIDIDSDKLLLEFEDTYFSLGSFRLFCKKNAGYPEISVDSLIVGCLGHASLNGLNEGELSEAEIRLKKVNETDNIEFTSRVKNIEIREDKMELLIQDSKVSLNEEFYIDIPKLRGECQKESGMLTFDLNEMLEKCMHSLNLKANKINVRDEVNKTSFNLITEKLAVSDERLLIEAPKVRLNAKDGSSTTLHSLSVDCKKNGIEYDIATVLEGCIESGKIDIKKLSSQESESKKQELNKIANQIIGYSGFSNKTSRRGRRGQDSVDDSGQSVVSDLGINVEEGNLSLETKIKFLLKFKLRIEANTSFDRDTNELMLEVTDAKLPLGIPAEKIVMYFVKKYFVSDTIRVEGKRKIYILFN